MELCFCKPDAGNDELPDDVSDDRSPQKPKKPVALRSIFSDSESEADETREQRKARMVC